MTKGVFCGVGANDFPSGSVISNGKRKVEGEQYPLDTEDSNSVDIMLIQRQRRAPVPSG